MYKALTKYPGFVVLTLLAILVLSTKVVSGFSQYSRETQAILDYISQREEIPVDQLMVAAEYQREYPTLGKNYWFVTVADAKSGVIYKVMMDLNDNTFIDNVWFIDKEEESALFAQYGKLEPSLYERLQGMGPDDKVEVAIWFTGDPTRTDKERYGILASQYPEAKEALDHSDKPFGVNDLELNRKLEAEYQKMLADDMLVIVKPLADDLVAQGYEVTIFDGMPSIAVILPKTKILDITTRIDVGSIYLIEEKPETIIDTAGPSDRVPMVWNTGATGSGVNIAILEIGKVSFTAAVY